MRITRKDRGWPTLFPVRLLIVLFLMLIVMFRC